MWLSETFDKNRAWIDMIGNANFKDSILFVRGNEVKIKRGQLAWSERFMAERWGWSRNKVRRFIEWLENRQQVKPQKSNIISLITIVNYGKYQSDDTTDDTTERPQTIPIHKKDKKNKKRNTKEKVCVIDFDEEKTKENLLELIIWFNEKQDTAFKIQGNPFTRLLPNFNYWCNGYTLGEMKKAVSNIRNHPYWSSQNVDMNWLLARKTSKGIEVDRFADLLGANKKLAEPKRMSSSEADDYLN